MREGARMPSIATRLTWMNVLVSGIALVLAFASFSVYNLFAYRQSAVNILSGEAQLIGANSVTALIFNDQQAAQNTLSALGDTGNVTGAVIYTPTGERFAQFGSLILQPPPISRDRPQDSWVNGTVILVGSRITIDGKLVGTVYIQAHLHGLRNQAIRYAVITGTLILFCLLAALLVGSTFRRVLAQPIVSLSNTARMVSRYRDYSLRFAPTHSYNELSSLTEAFNEMLSEIQTRDKALELARESLEARVDERTAQLRAVNQELESFSYSVAHDLRGPLEIISGITYLLKESEENAVSEQGREMLERLGFSVQEMSSLIEDLLNLSRATTTSLHVTRIDLSLMANNILEDLRRAHPERQVQFHVQPDCHAFADPGLMQIVLQNLLRNAWKFTGREDEARIEFGCQRTDEGDMYFVRDNGAGFDQVLASRLFKPFQRLHAESDFTGTGIGLATVKRILDRHEGKIWAKGEVHRGATFYFTLGALKP